LIDPPLPSDTLETWEQYWRPFTAYPPNTLGRNEEIKLTKSPIAKMKGQAKASSTAALPALHQMPFWRDSKVRGWPFGVWGPSHTPGSATALSDFTNDS